METTELFNSSNISTINITKDDIIVVKNKNKLTGEQNCNMSKYFENRFKDNKVIVIDENIDISILHIEDI